RSSATRSTIPRAPASSSPGVSLPSSPTGRTPSSRGEGLPAQILHAAKIDLGSPNRLPIPLHKNRGLAPVRLEPDPQTLPRPRPETIGPGAREGAAGSLCVSDKRLGLLEKQGRPAGSAMSDFRTKSAFSYEDLLSCGHGRLFGPGNARLPLPPMLMFDRIVHISETGGAHGKGQAIAEFDIKPDLW